MKPKFYLLTILGTAWVAAVGNLYANEPAASNRTNSSATITAASAGDREVTPIDEVRRGQRVTLQGEVTRLLDEDEFILRDETGRIKIYIGWQNDMPVDVGDKVIVVGIADDDAFPGRRPEIYARTLILESGTTINLRTGEVINGS